jgi:hypothetical protein
MSEALTFPIQVWRDQYFRRDFLKRLMIPTVFVCAICCFAMLKDASFRIDAQALSWAAVIFVITVCMILMFLFWYYMRYKPASIMIHRDHISVMPIDMLWFSGGWLSDYRVDQFQIIDVKLVNGRYRDIWTIILRGIQGVPDLNFEPPAGKNANHFAGQLGAALQKRVNLHA